MNNNWITIKWTVVSKENGETVNWGKCITLVKDGKLPESYQLPIYKTLTALWPMDKYEVTIPYKRGIDTNFE